MRFDQLRPNRNWLRFRLWALILTTFVLSLPLAWFGRQYNVGRATAARIQELGGVPVRSMRWDYRWGRVIGANFEAAKITDAELVQLKSMSTLGWVNLQKTQITDAGIAHLVAAIPQLRMLYLSDTELTDAGLKHIEKLPYLEFLQAHRTKITGEGVEKLKKSRPDLDVYWSAK
jgi:hypothetical protein